MAVSRKLLTEGEHEVFSVRTHVKALFLPALVLLLTCLVAGFAWGYAPGGDSGRYLGYAALVIAGLVILVWAVAPFVRWLCTTYTVTNRRLIEQSGVFTRSGRVIPLIRINDVSFEKHLTDRVLGCGTLMVHAASELPGLTLHDVPRVEEVHRTLSNLVHDVQDAPDDDGARGVGSRSAGA